jgi:hypothetical protein
MKWKQPPIKKVYEALGAVVDGRIEAGGDGAKVYSSSGNKFYEVFYDPIEQAIMANDNASYWQGYLGYPAIAFLMKVGVVSFDKKVGELLQGVAWKDLNVKYKGNFEKVWASVIETKTETEKQTLEDFANKVLKEIKKLNLGYLGKRIPPPDGY